jgi:hypothetical protein
MLTAGISTKAVAREFNVNFSSNVILENLAVRPMGLTTADHVYGFVRERFADNIVNIVPHGGVMVWAGISYGQQTQLHFINVNLNAQRYRDEILRPIGVPFICRHHLMFHHDNAKTHVARICTQLLEAEHVPVILWPAYSPDMLPIELFGMLWIDSVFQFPPISSNFTQPLKRSGTTFHRPQSTD